jgi:hypothetical protein
MSKTPKLGAGRGGAGLGGRGQDDARVGELGEDTDVGRVLELAACCQLGSGSTELSVLELQLELEQVEVHSRTAMVGED